MKREANEHPAPGGLRWSRNMPLPRKYQILFDAFVAVQQVFPMMRRRGKGSNTEELCAGVEEATRRRCTVETLRAIEALRPGTLSLSLKPGVRDDDARAVSDPRRVRVDFPESTGRAAAAAPPRGASANDAFRQTLVDRVADGHADSFHRGPFHFERSESNVGPEVAVVSNTNQFRGVDGAVELAQDNTLRTN